MRKENRRQARDNGLDFKKILYISGSILALAIIAFVITFLTYGNKLEQNTKMSRLNTSIVDNYSENTEEASSQFGKTVNEMSNEIGSKNDNSIENETNTTKYAVNTSQTENKVSVKKTTTTDKKTTNTAKAQTNTSKTENKNQKKIEDPTFKMPVSGEIIKEFAKDKLVYSNTLGEWITHTGIDIKAEKTTVVKASAEGSIKSIKNDPRYGLTVVIEHINGFTTVYSNLLTAEFVVKGEKVKQGQTIGTVGNTATFEISDEAHLHFEILKDGVNLDPELYIKK